MAGQKGFFGVPGWTFHDQRIPLSHTQSQSGKHVGDQVQKKDLQRQDGQRGIRRRGKGDGHDLADIAGDEVPHELTDVTEDDPPLPDGGDDGGEGIIFEDHIGGLTGHLGAPFSHGDADIGFFQGRGVVDPVAGHGHDGAVFLMEIDEVQLLFGAHPGENRGAQDVLSLFSGKLAGTVQVLAVNHLGLPLIDQAHSQGDVARRKRLIAGGHDHTNAGLLTQVDGLTHILAGRVLQPDQAKKSQLLVRFGVDRIDHFCG